MNDLTEMELEAVTAVFKQFETGVREAAISGKDLLPALKCLGLNTMEQEIMDLINSTVSKDGLIYFPDFSKIVLKRYREESQLEFAKIIFKVFCGTDPLPTQFRAKKYKLEQKFLTKKDFTVIMRSLPVSVSEEDIQQMFAAVDTNNRGQIGFQGRKMMTELIEPFPNQMNLQEFCGMINPCKPPEGKKPTRSEFTSFFQSSNM